jgi:hypothetical protein
MAGLILGSIPPFEDTIISHAKLERQRNTAQGRGETNE